MGPDLRRFIEDRAVGSTRSRPHAPPAVDRDDALHGLGEGRRVILVAPPLPSHEGSI
jgi:hypothetical protein